MRKTEKRNRAVVLLMVPIIIVMWFVGWSLYWIGSQKRKLKKARKLAQIPNYVVLIMLGGCLDIWSTIWGVSRGFQESSSMFLMAPWLVTVVLAGTAFLVERALPSAPARIRTLLPYALAAFSFMPGIHNLILIFTASPVLAPGVSPLFWRLIS